MTVKRTVRKIQKTGRRGWVPRLLVAVAITYVAAIGFAKENQFPSLPLSSVVAHPSPSKKSSQQQTSATFSAEELFRRYQPAVVKVLIRQQQIPIATGTGFFVSSQGDLVTNHHVIKNALKTGSFSVEFALSDGTVIKDFLVANCRDERQIDLCLLKLPVKPKSWFKLANYKPAPGETIYVIGHPQGLDFSISNGIVSALRESPTNVQELQISAAISPGNSGGPIFNSHGTLVGVANKFYKDGQNLNFGILVGEVSTYINKNKQFASIRQYRKNYDTKTAQMMKRWTTQEIDPAYANIEAGRPLSTNQLFKDFTFNFSDDKMTVPLPKAFEGCRKTETRRGATAFQCSAMNNTAILSVSRIVANPASPLSELEGQKPMKEKPLPLVEMLMEEGTWAEHEKSLGPDNRKYLFSIPSEAKCRKMTGNVTPNAAFTDGSTQCRFSVFNDLEPDSYSYSLWVQRGRYVYDFYIWMEDAGLAEYYNHVPTLAVLGARQEGRIEKSVPSTTPGAHIGTAQQGLPGTRDVASQIEMRKTLENLELTNVKTPFLIDLPSSFALSTRQPADGDGSLSFIYNRSPEPANTKSSTFFMVHVLKKTVTARELPARARQLLHRAVQDLGAHVDMKQVKSEKVNVGGLSGLVQTSYGRRDSSNVAIFHAAVIAPSATYTILGFCDPNEADTTFKDFQKMTASLRVK